MKMVGLVMCFLMSFAQAQGALVNGGFETGDLTGWSAEVPGMVVVDSSSGVTPKEGSYMLKATANILGPDVYQHFSVPIQGTVSVWLRGNGLDHPIIYLGGSNGNAIVAGYNYKYGQSAFELLGYENGYHVWGDYKTSVAFPIYEWFELKVEVNNGVAFYVNDTLISTAGFINDVKTIQLDLGTWSQGSTYWDNLTVPEPATMTFIALGLAGMLRRKYA